MKPHYLRVKKSGRCREVAVVERWPLVEVRLFFLQQGNSLDVKYQLVCQA